MQITNSKIYRFVAHFCELGAGPATPVKITKTRTKFRQNRTLGRLPAMPQDCRPSAPLAFAAASAPQGPIAIDRRLWRDRNSAVFRFDLRAPFQVLESEPKSVPAPINKNNWVAWRFIAIT